MPSSHFFGCSLKAIRNLFKTFVSPAFLYSEFDASKDALVDLVALEIICSNSELDPKPQQLNGEQQETLLREGTTKRCNGLPDYLSTCYEALNFFHNLKTDNEYTVESYLVFQLVNALKETEEKELTDRELAKSIACIETHIKFSVLLNNFFQYLKALNKGEFQDKGLASLLSKLDSKESFIFSPEKLVVDPLTLLEEISLYLAEKITHIITNEKQAKKRAFLLDSFEKIKKLNLIIRSRYQLKEGYQAGLLTFAEKDHNKINALFLEYARQSKKNGDTNTFEILEETSQSIEISPERSSLNALKSLFAMDIWDSQAKGVLSKPIPQGIQEIREILNDEKFSAERKLVAMMVVVAKRLEKPIDDRNLIVHQLYIELKRNIFTKYFLNLYKTIAEYPVSISREQYQEVKHILTSQSSSITDTIATIKDKTEKTATSLEGTIQRIPTAQIKEFLTKLSAYFPDERQLRGNKAILELKALLRKLSKKATKDDTEGKLEVIKDFSFLYVFLKHKIPPYNTKAIKAKEYLLYKDLFDTLESVIEAFRDDGYQALLDKICCHKGLHGRKLLAALQSVKGNKVMASPSFRSVQDLFPIDEKLVSALIKASEKLDVLVPFQKRWLGPLASTPLGGTLSLFREEVQKKHKERFFVPTGIKQLKRLFEKWDNRNPLNLSKKEAVIELLNDIDHILGKRLQQNSKRSQSLKNFYENKRGEFTKLMPKENSVDETRRANRSVGDIPLSVATETPAESVASDTCDEQTVSLQEQKVVNNSDKGPLIQSSNRYTFLSRLTSSITSSFRSSSPDSSDYEGSSEIKCSDEAKGPTSHSPISRFYFS
jgi:hypothetical protein